MSEPMPSGVRRRELQYEIEQLYYTEADLLDDRRFDEWLELLDDSVVYWMPLGSNVPSKALGDAYTRQGQDMAWYDEDKDALTKRVRQFATGMHWAEEPVSRVSHLVTNVRLVEIQGTGDDTTVVARSRFFVYQNRLEDEVNLFVGKRVDTWRRDAGSDAGWKLQRREIYLDQSVMLAKSLTVFL